VPNVLRLVNSFVGALPRIDPSRDLLVAAAGSAGPTDAPATVAAQSLTKLQLGLGTEIGVTAAAILRLPVLPVLVPTPTLQQLVTRGRALLLGAQQTARNTELTAVQKTVGDLQAALAANLVSKPVT
jgi:hypothetical protein